MRHSKEALRSEVDELRRQQRSSEQILWAIAQPQLGESVLAALRNGRNVDAITKWVGEVSSSSTGSVPNVEPPEPKTVADVPLGQNLYDDAGSASGGRPPTDSYATSTRRFDTNRRDQRNDAPSHTRTGSTRSDPHFDTKQQTADPLETGGQAPRSRTSLQPSRHRILGK